VTGEPGGGGGVEEVGAVLEEARSRPPSSARGQQQVEARRVVVSGGPARSGAQAGQHRARPAAAAFWSANRTWNRGRVGEVRSGSELLDQLLERQVLVGVGGQGRARTRPRSSAKVGSPARSPRSTRVLTKKPIRPSTSERVRPATGVPTGDVACPARRAQAPGRPARRAMKAVGPAPGQARSPPGQLGRQRHRQAARRGGSAPAAGAGRWAARGAAGAPARRSRQKASWRARTSPASHSRCQTAKSAYWTGSSGSGEGRPPKAP
jgi:hypothetical protein